MGRKLREPGWCFVGYMDGNGKPRLMDIAEWSLPWALQQGWSLVFRYGDKLTEDVDPAQSNPKRVDDPEC